MFRGAGWNVIKVIWGSKWDELLAKDKDGVLLNKMNTTVDGEFQRYARRDRRVHPRALLRARPPAAQAGRRTSADDELRNLPRGGHDYRKLYAAYKAATENLGSGAPTVILAKTIKGWTLGPGVRGPQRHPPDQEDDQGAAARRCATGCTCTTRSPRRRSTATTAAVLPAGRGLGRVPVHDGAPPGARRLAAQRASCAPRGRSTLPDRHAVRRAARRLGQAGGVDHDGASPACCATCARDEQFGQRVVPIIPDEARTFGMDALFRELKIYAAQGQKYEPVDHDLLLSYTESPDGPDPRGGHHRGRLDGQLHRRRHRATPPAACRWCRSSSSIRCSASSGSATSSGRPPTPAPAASCSAPPPGAPRCSARACSTRTATASCWPRPCRRARPTTRPSPTRWPRSCKHGLAADVRRHGRRRPRRLLLPHLYNENYAMPADARATSAPSGIVERPVPVGGRAGRPSKPRRRSCSPARPRGAAREAAGRARRALRRRRRAVVGHVVQGAARGGADGRALEPPAPRPGAAHAARSPSCSATAPGPIVAVTDFMKVVPDQIARFVPRPRVRAARHRRLRPHRHPRGAAPALRDRRRPRRGRRARRPGRARATSSREVVADAIARYGIDPDAARPRSTALGTAGRMARHALSITGDPEADGLLDTRRLGPAHRHAARPAGADGVGVHRARPR